MQDLIKEAFAVLVVEHYNKYQDFIGRSKKASFDYIKQRIWKKKTSKARKAK